jgi:hypothetical protein
MFNERIQNNMVTYSLASRDTFHIIAVSYEAIGINEKYVLIIKYLTNSTDNNPP